VFVALERGFADKGPPGVQIVFVGPGEGEASLNHLVHLDVADGSSPERRLPMLTERALPKPIGFEAAARSADLHGGTC
jgi:hypothetical protein